MTTRKFDGEWMPRYGAWWFDSERVDALSDGAYRLYDWLLWRQWEHESIPANPSTIVPARFAKRWKALWAEVSPFFEKGDDGRLRNDTCAAVRADSMERRGKSSARGRNGAAVTNAKRWGVRSDDRSSDHLSDHSSDPPSDAQPIAPVSLSGRTLPDRTEPDRPPKPPSGGGESGVPPGSAERMPSTNGAHPPRGTAVASLDARPLPPVASRSAVLATGIRDAWCRRFREVTHRDYPWNEFDDRQRPNGRDAKALRALVAQLASSSQPIEDFRHATEVYFANAFYANDRGYSLATLAKGLPEFLRAEVPGAAVASGSAAAARREPTRAEREERSAWEIAEGRAADRERRPVRAWSERESLCGGNPHVALAVQIAAGHGVNGALVAVPSVAGSVAVCSATACSGERGA